MSAETNKILARAAGQPLCDVVVLGVLPSGQGLYMDWSGSTVASLVLMLEAAKQEAIATYIDGINGKSLEAAE
jgi:hypothetical protein